MFKAVLDDVTLVRDSLDAVSNFINEGTFKLSKNGLSLIAMDPANVAMVLYDLLASAFTEYECSSKTKLTVNVPYLVSILKRAGTGDSVEFKMTDSANELVITMTGDSKRTFTLPLLEAHGNPVKPPEKLKDGFKAEVEVESAAIKAGAKDALMVSDCVLLSTTKDSFVMKALSDTNEVNLQLSNESPSLIKLDSKSAVKSKYSLEYLEKMMKLSKVAKTVELRFADNYPLKLDYKALDQLKVSFILAPRIDTE
ncbi:proliferating cell nuclear antigen (pcna) [archaeon]|nr:proliferating cell nuclear antigen (pcna) [archaeon]